MSTNKSVEEFFPTDNESEIKHIIDHFAIIYKKISSEVVYDIEEILTNSQYHIEEINSTINYGVSTVINQNEISEKLYDAFPGYNKELILALKNRIDNTAKEDEINDKIDKLINKQSNYYLINPNYLDFNRTYINISRKIGVFDENNEESSDLENKYENPIENQSIYNYKENYKKWIGKKLLLSEKEIENTSLESLENKMRPFLELAINHILKVLSSIKIADVSGLKSAYFKSIHYQEKKMSIFNLFKFFYKLEKNKRNETKKNKSKNTKQRKKDLERYSRYLDQVNKGQFEIQRILALTNLYMQREYTLTFQNSKEEQDFLISKLSELGSDDMKNNYIDLVIESDNLLYNYTIKKDLYWKKISNPGNKKVKTIYSLLDKYEEGFKKTSLSSFEMEGKYTNASKNTNKLQILHVGSRIKKNPFSSVEKYLRKRLSSFDEILDHKGFIFVVDNYGEDLVKLKKLLNNNFGTDDTSWSEELESMQKAGNNNTDSEYNSYKGIINVNYKGKLIKKFFDLLGDAIESKQIKIFKTELKKLKNEGINNSNIGKYEALVKQINNPELQYCYKDLKVKIGNTKYLMQVEIQIFDKENYIKAEIDEESPAYHGRYKGFQTIETLAIYFPQEKYGYATKEVMKSELINLNKKGIV